MKTYKGILFSKVSGKVKANKTETNKLFFKFHVKGIKGKEITFSEIVGTNGEKAIVRANGDYIGIATI